MKNVNKMIFMGAGTGILLGLLIKFFPNLFFVDYLLITTDLVGQIFIKSLKMILVPLVFLDMYPIAPQAHYPQAHCPQALCLPLPSRHTPPFFLYHDDNAQKPVTDTAMPPSTKTTAAEAAAAGARVPP